MSALQQAGELERHVALAERGGAEERDHRRRVSHPPGAQPAVVVDGGAVALRGTA